MAWKGVVRTLTPVEGEDVSFYFHLKPLLAANARKEEISHLSGSIGKRRELTREGTLGDLGLDVAAESRASSLDGSLAHERGHLGGNDAC